MIFGILVLCSACSQEPELNNIKDGIIKKLKADISEKTILVDYDLANIVKFKKFKKLDSISAKRSHYMKISYVIAFVISLKELPETQQNMAIRIFEGGFKKGDRRKKEIFVRSAKFGALWKVIDLVPDGPNEGGTKATNKLGI